MTDETELVDLRRRLYSAYATGHAGVADAESQMPAFRRDILPHLPANRQAEILDIGCGPGHYVKHLLELGFSNTRGIDTSPEQVALAHAAGLFQVELGDYRKSLEAGALDLLIATDFLEHFKNWEVLQVLDRTRMALRPGGSLIIRVPNAGSPFAGMIRYGDMTHETSFTERSLQQLGAAAGYAKVRVFACPPPVHGFLSALRAGVWGVASSAMKLALIAETGQVSGHLVTQNVVAVMTVSGSQAVQPA